MVKNKDECGDREMAAVGPPGPVTVFSAARGAIGSPTGFAAAAASGILVGVIAVIAAGAAAAGIVGGVVVKPTTGATPPPPIVEPDADTDPDAAAAADIDADHDVPLGDGVGRRDEREIAHRTPRPRFPRGPASAAGGPRFRRSD